MPVNEVPVPQSAQRTSPDHEIRESSSNGSHVPRDQDVPLPAADGSHSRPGAAHDGLAGEESVLMQAPVAILVLRGPDHVIELVSPVACRLWGREQSTLVNKGLFDALPELRGQACESRLDGVYQSGVPYTGSEEPARIERPANGTLDTLHFNFACTPLRNSRHVVDGILVIALDVSAEVRARKDVERLRSEAERATKAKDRFLAVLSHELRTPLTSLLLQVELLRRRSSDRRDLLAIIEAMERAVKAQSRITDDLLDVSRLVAGKLDLQTRPLQFVSVVREALDTVRPLAEQKGVDLNVSLDAAFAPVMGDSLRLRQAVWNLLVNAVKFTPPESLVTVRVTTDPGFVHLEISDTGVGIGPEFLPHVFDLFTGGGGGGRGAR